MAKNPRELAIVLGIGGKRPGGPPPTFPREAPPKAGGPGGGGFAPPENPETEKPNEADETDERVAPERAGLVAPGARCGICEHFDGQGACEKVAGPIDPEQVCYTFYEPKGEAQEEMSEGRGIPAPREEPPEPGEAE